MSNLGEILGFHPKPQEVFTPRSPLVNDAMYVDRPDLEASLKRAIDSDKHVIIHGESGTGKTWLYKKTFANLGINYETINMANVNRFGSLDRAFEEFVKARLAERQVSRATEYEGKLDAGVVGGGGTFSSDYEIVEAEPFLRCLRHISTGKKPTVLIFDNFERVIADAALLKATVDVLALLDDDSYSRYNVKLAIVGTPNNIREYFARISEPTTIANRVTEVAEVARLSKSQAAELIERGFKRLHLNNSVSNGDLTETVSWFTDRIPQQVHELCLEVARVSIANNRTISEKTFTAAVETWLGDSLVSSYAVISDKMNAIETKIGRRNQTLFVLGNLDVEDFSVADVEAKLRETFSTETVTLNLFQVLAELAAGDSPLLVRPHGTSHYRFVNPKYRMCLRALLKRNPDGRVRKVDFKQLQEITFIAPG